MDGNDSSSIRADGAGLVDLWEDKSGKGNDFEDYTADGRPSKNSSGGVTLQMVSGWSLNHGPVVHHRILKASRKFTILLAAQGDSSGKRMVVIANPGPTGLIWKRMARLVFRIVTAFGRIRPVIIILVLPVWESGEGRGQVMTKVNSSSMVAKNLSFSGDPDSSDLVVNPSNSYLAIGHNTIGFAGQIFEILIFAKKLTDEKQTKSRVIWLTNGTLPRVYLHTMHIKIKHLP